VGKKVSPKFMISGTREGGSQRSTTALLKERKYRTKERFSFTKFQVEKKTSWSMRRALEALQRFQETKKTYRRGNQGEKESFYVGQQRNKKEGSVQTFQRYGVSMAAGERKIPMKAPRRQRLLVSPGGRNSGTRVQEDQI